MSDCGVCLGDFDGDPVEFCDITWVTARKEHRCAACQRTIPKDARYNRFAGKCDGDMFVVCTCSDCDDIRSAFTCADDNAIPSEILWETMEEYVFPEMTTACFARVKTESAREYLRERWMKWKGLTT